MIESSWPEVIAAIDAAPYPVEVLPPNPAAAQAMVSAMEITTRSWLGAVVANSGGIVIDHGWLRVLGSGGAGLVDVMADAEPRTGFLVIAYDVLGGTFAWAQAQPDARPTVHYFGPDDLGWQDLEQGYAEWLHAMLAGSMTGFYTNLRWPGWETEVANVRLDEGIHTYPPPWTAEGKNLAAVSRRAIPLAELLAFHQDTARQLSGG